MKNYLNNFSLKNKKAVVIGGCGLIGRENLRSLFYLLDQKLQS